MSAELDQLKDELTTFLKRIVPHTIRQAKVNGINDDDTISVVLSDETVIDDARLRSVVKAGSKKISVPAIDSTVLVGKIETGDEYVVIAVEQIDRELVSIGDTEVEVTEDGVRIEKGGDSIKDILLLIVQSNKQVAVLYGNNEDFVKLQQAETKINNLFL